MRFIVLTFFSFILFFLNLSFFFFLVYRITELLTNIREGEGRGGDGAGRERVFCVKFLFFFFRPGKSKISLKGQMNKSLRGFKGKNTKNVKKAT